MSIVATVAIGVLFAWIHGRQTKAVADAVRDAANRLNQGLGPKPDAK